VGCLRDSCRGERHDAHRTDAGVDAGIRGRHDVTSDVTNEPGRARTKPNQRRLEPLRRNGYPN
jgi:hypothetical protein